MILYLSLMSEEFKDYYDGIMEMVVVKTNNIPYAESLVSKNYFRIKTGFYEDENPNTIVEELVFQIKEHLKERGKILIEGLVVERRVTDAPIREIVRTLVNIIKSNTHLFLDFEIFSFSYKNYSTEIFDHMLVKLVLIYKSMEFTITIDLFKT